MVTQEEIRRIRIENMRKTGVLGLLKAKALALKAGVDPALVVKITAKYYMGELTPKQAEERLRRLAGRRGNGRAA